MAHSSSSESSRSGSDGDLEPSDPCTHVLPGPYRWEVLRKRTQRNHVSQVVWNEDTVRGLKTRRGKLQGGPHHDDIPDVVADYLTQAGFIHVARMSHVQIDTPLISALVERWRPETHTFHMTQGEMTVTLQDVAGILGLPTDGQEVFGTTPVTGTDIHGGDLRISYLDKIYADWFTVAHNPEEVRRYTKAHILRLLGSWFNSLPPFKPHEQSWYWANLDTLYRDEVCDIYY
ncbi:protein MAIN-LIKE 2-like [Gastrolobium bilobum]|uniref:protein MAIN-LIKE 2-like n=1 Tax=Gastrolobium bilobum TaxID=150636 RepID=UPI002AB16762|nr:protein MAIN-LIKE 2-like [Gastrolobium bilobum]